MYGIVLLLHKRVKSQNKKGENGYERSETKIIFSDSFLVCFFD